MDLKESQFKVLMFCQIFDMLLLCEIVNQINSLICFYAINICYIDLIFNKIIHLTNNLNNLRI